MTDLDSPSPEDDLLPFTPVPTASNRHDGWTAERQRRFIAALAQMGVVAAAARAVGKSHTSAYRLRARPDAASFVEAWEIAVMMGQDRQYAIAMDRAINGFEVPCFRRGHQVGTVKKIDYRLTLAALRAVLVEAAPQPTSPQLRENAQKAATSATSPCE